MTNYVALIGFEVVYRQWRKNWKISNRFDILALSDGNLSERVISEIEEMESLGLIVFESWKDSPDYDEAMTEWLHDKAASVYDVSRVCPVVKRGSIVDWRKKNARQVEPAPSFKAYSTRLTENEIQKLKQIESFLLQKTGLSSASAALRYAVQQFNEETLT